MFSLLFDYIEDDGSVSDSREEKYTDAKSVFDRIDVLLKESPSYIYASPEYLRRLCKLSYDVLTKDAELGIPNDNKLQGHLGWELRGTRAHDEDGEILAAKVAGYLGSIVEDEYNRSRRGMQSIRITATNIKRLRTLWLSQ